MMKVRKVLDEKGIEVIINRMAHQVFEQFCDFDDLVILGIAGEGFVLAEKIKSRLDQMGVMKTRLFKLSLQKHQPRKPQIHFFPPLPDLDGIPVLLVDDVLNSGRTLSYCLGPLLEFAIPSLKLAVLVERLYRKFPVSSSITGLELSTTMEENVIAVLDPSQGEIGVFLN